MDVTVTLSKDTIMPEVYKITGHAGAKGGGMEQVSSTEDDIAVLESYFGEAVNNMADTMAWYGTLSSYDADTAVFAFELPANWKTAMQSALEQAMELYAINYICMQWFNLTKKDEVQYYANVCTGQAAAARRCLLERERPSRNN